MLNRDHSPSTLGVNCTLFTFIAGNERPIMRSSVARGVWSTQLRAVADDVAALRGEARRQSANGRRRRAEYFMAAYSFRSRKNDRASGVNNGADDGRDVGCPFELIEPRTPGLGRQRGKMSRFVAAGITPSTSRNAADRETEQFFFIEVASADA